jgi:hypothetical protein
MARILMLAFALALAACSPTYHTIKLVNRTDRPIEEIYIYPTGATNHGKSRASLAPDTSTEVKVPSGNVDVLAVSAKVRVNDTESETRTASQTVELKGPRELVFHDSNKPPPGLDRPGTLGVMFRVDPEPPQPEESAEPAPE